MICFKLKIQNPFLTDFFVLINSFSLWISKWSWVFFIHVYDHHDEKTDQTLLQQVVHTHRIKRGAKAFISKPDAEKSDLEFLKSKQHVEQYKHDCVYISVINQNVPFSSTKMFLNL